ERMRQAEQIRNKSIASVYKQLAKVLHPDLEPDAGRKQAKGTLMQELTAAYPRWVSPCIVHSPRRVGLTVFCSHHESSLGLAYQGPWLIVWKQSGRSAHQCLLRWECRHGVGQRARPFHAHNNKTPESQSLLRRGRL